MTEQLHLKHTAVTYKCATHIKTFTATQQWWDLKNTWNKEHQTMHNLMQCKLYRHHWNK